MLVYGDRFWSEAPAAIVERIGAALSWAAATAGLLRHGHLTDAWTEAALLLQGIADADFAMRGSDESSETQRAATALAMACSRALIASWDGGFRGDGEAAEMLARVAGAMPSSPLRLVEPEGIAFYALYPEAYLQAARVLRGEGAVRVMGLRSIGAGLAAVVAAALGAPDPITVRPVGDPFRRRLALGPEMRASIAAAREALWLVVDEGPGLSGSSFSAAHDALAAEGIARVHYFPGHAGEPGAECSAENRRRWRATPRHVSLFERWAIADAPPGQGLGDWAADLVGKAAAPLDDIGAGAWRNHLYTDDCAWPPVWAAQERRKYLARTESGTWLLKFAGLGRAGERKLEIAEKLSAAGFTPAVAGLRHGFLVERWIGDSKPLPDDYPKPLLIAHLGRYLGFRAAQLGADAAGASLATLARMAQRNTALGLGEEEGHRAAALCAPLLSLQNELIPVAIDGRLQRWEWRLGADARPIKTDAVDHHAAHDLVGCQDIVWDIAGAAIEFGFDEADLESLCRAVEQASGRAVLRPILPMMRLCYAAFQLGRATYAAEGAGASERPRSFAGIGRYRMALAGALTA